VPFPSAPCGSSFAQKAKKPSRPSGKKGANENFIENAVKEETMYVPPPESKEQRQ
jgi:hypothetical protein